MKLLIIIFAIILSGCGISIKSDDLTVLEKNVNAQTGSVTRNGAAEIFGSHTTLYNEKSVGRAHNIKLAASRLNETEIEPGATFSYNDCIGATGKSSGYKKARIFVQGRDSEGYGGGVCQVSSTLYNAVLKAKLSIVERHPHSKPVAYVPKDKDAATSYGGIDFKFKNDTSSTLIITTSTGEGKLTVDIKSI